MPTTFGTTTEYALMVDWEDGQPAVFIPAQGVIHAETLARTLYEGTSCWTVGREVQPWRYVDRTTGQLTSVEAPARD